ncbi:DNA-binding transcriptional regulator, MarR family [Sulfitobacter marinus]|uniref:DNA-binding transcriptional regulator, MarR family n=1 Tax=Sulfitobacter marinus TaxID=394264 RepID=A0A1I6VDX9_9RHOB|nr:MarR family winged helix-turn-helix transcriptional regulator [Sulfitobacter marinus]SFT11916.1 DNA-binding transcriptional regulator, MarR family [Sulfitobacter marinus]
MTKPAQTPTGTAQDGPVSSPISNSALPDFTGYLIKRSWVTIQRDLRDVLLGFDLSQRSMSVLSVVIGNPDINQSDVAAALSIERSGMVVIVDELEGLDLIRRTRAATDRRAYALRATLKGHQLHERVRAAIIAHEDRIFANISPAERASLHTILLKLVEG